MSKAKDKHKGESRQHFRLCVPPCPRYVTGGDTHSLCVVCLGAEFAQLALEGADCASACCKCSAPAGHASRSVSVLVTLQF